MNISKPRQEWADVAKGLSMLAVIAGHLGSSTINRLVYLWHLPVFFLISGYFLKIRPNTQFIKNKVQSLLIPYYLTCAAICVTGAVSSLLTGKDVLETVRHWMWATLYAAGDSWTWPINIEAIGAIWFLWALFFGMLIVHHLAEKKYGVPAIIAIAVTGWVSFEKSRVWLPLSIQSGMLCSLYILIGYLVKRKDVPGRFKTAGKPVWVLLILCSMIITGIGVKQFKGFWLVHDYMGNGWLDFGISLCAAALVVSVAILISTKTGFLKRLLMFYGVNSLWILCLHIIDLDVLHVEKIMMYCISSIGGEGLMQNMVFMTVAIYGIKVVYVSLGVLLLKRLVASER